MPSNKITIVDYDPAWSNQFEALSKVLVSHLGDDIIAIEHVGSTSVKGLKAKPIIDLDIVVANNDKVLQLVIAKMAQLGYIHRGDLGIAGREAFKRPSNHIPQTPENRIWFNHHVYVCKKGNLGLNNHLRFRDYLKSHPEAVVNYGNLKQMLAEKFPDNIDAYIDGKTDFITNALIQAGLDNEQAKIIEQQNKSN